MRTSESLENSQALPVAFDKDSFKKEREIIGWNVDHNRVTMRNASLKDIDGKEIWDGDLRLYKGRLYKVVDHGWRFCLERNKVEFGDNELIPIDEDVAYLTALVGDFYQNSNLLVK